MRIVVTDSAVKFTEHFYRSNLITLALQTDINVRHFLAKGGRRGRLTVGTRHHRNGFVLYG